MLIPTPHILTSIQQLNTHEMSAHGGEVSFFDTVIDAVSDGFMDIGLYLAVALFVVMLIIGRWGKRWESALQGKFGSGPLLASLLSLPPGCSGVVAVVSMYSRNVVSYGTVISAFVATMGDAAWVLLAVEPLLAVKLKMLFAALGFLLGYAVDLFKIEPRKPAEQAFGLPLTVLTDGHRAARRPTTSRSIAVREAPRSPATGPVIPAPGSRPPSILHEPGKTGLPAATSVIVLSRLFWFVIILGLLIKIPIDFGVVDEGFYEDLIPGLNPYQIIGITGAIVAASLGTRLAIARRYESGTEANRQSDHRSVSLSVSRQASVTISLVVVAYLALDLIVHGMGFELSNMPFHGLVGVLLGCLFGIIPSCGLETVAAALFVAGGMPLPAFIAFLLSHAGAGFLPLFVVHRKSALLSVALLLPPAFVVSLLFLFFS